MPKSPARKATPVTGPNVLIDKGSYIRVEKVHACGRGRKVESCHKSADQQTDSDRDFFPACQWKYLGRHFPDNLQFHGYPIPKFTAVGIASPPLVPDGLIVLV